ncbi:hypothetical protein MVES1_003933 [Malassezia vespertilionis]|uniref:Uncharacterized protein n=1 Tax=Malassezia vespertilionis TaxID=2020962 RepID=A0A2N1J840_9BASI|nr:uncharacterized protein MVES1_003933 [Malassezia vespertilionis]PKI82703.1 hypothetical protein MVES_003488 [Malassezia vespertilionis]WFD08557.1 hypothetical protein MVES1_003933 [Malassezia vespertilionis]
MVRFTSLIAAAATIAATALPVFASATGNSDEGLVARTVYAPKITYPKKSTEWRAGTHVHITWSVSDIPDDVKGTKGMVKLGHLDPNDPGEHLANTLAKGFPITDGRVGFELPDNLEERDDYIVVLFGDSGNASPEFTIHSA